MCKRLSERREYHANYDSRYRWYAEAKAKIPLDLPAEKYESEVRRLAKKYKI